MLVAGFGDGVDLDGEGDWNAAAVQLASEFGGFGCSPTVAVEDDGSLLFFEGGEDAVVVGVEEAYELMEGFSTVMIAEDFGMNGGVTVAKVCGELDFGVLRVVAANEASDKAYDDGVSSCRGR